MDDTTKKRPPWTDDERPAAAGSPGEPANVGIGGPPDFAPETAGPMFSKGGNGPDDPPPGGLWVGSHPLTDEEKKERAKARPDRRTTP